MNFGSRQDDLRCAVSCADLANRITSTLYQEVATMYQPEHYRIDDIAQMHALMRAHPFAALVTSGGACLFATHLPTVLKVAGSRDADDDTGAHGVIECHIARANPHWKEIAEAPDALVIFSGPHGYITPNWYPSKQEHGKVVPTWIYGAVHAYGRVEVMQDPAWLRRHVGELTDQQEATEATPWAVSDAPDEFIAVMLRGIVGFRIQITRLEGKLKMSQNREPVERKGVVDGLRARGLDGDAVLADGVARLFEGDG